MTYDDNIATLFLMNFEEAYRSGKLLLLSYNRITHLMPLNGEKMGKLTVDDLDKLDAFRVRFCDLQDSLGSKTFRSLLKLEEEEAKTQLDIINKMEKRSIIPSFDEWHKLREIRNLFSHDYPDSEDQRADSLNIAFQNSLKLIDTLNNVKAYVEKEIQIPMKDFLFLNKKSG